MSARRGSLRLLLARTVLGTLVLGAALVLAPPAQAQADEPVALATIRLTSIEPALPQRDGKVTLAGQVTNTSNDRIVRPQAVFWRNQAPITTAEGLDQALGSASNEPLGTRYTDAFQNLFSTGTPYLAPGKSAGFRLTVSVAALALAPTDGVYLMGVHVLADGVPIAVARTRVFVPVLDDQPQQRSTVTSLVVLDSRPSQIADGLLVDDHLAREVAAGGRLTRLLAAARQEASSFAVDPGLVEELQTMRAGYAVRTREGGSTPGTGQADATRWLSDLAELKSDHDGYRLLYGSPDVAALVHAGQTSVLADAAAAGKAVPLTADLPLLVLPTAGAADAATVQALDALGPRAVLLADSATGGAGPLLTGPGDTPVVTYTATGLGGGPGPDPRNDAVHIAQRTLATSWVRAATAAADDPATAQVRLVRSAAQAQSTDGSADPPWVRPAPLSSLLSRTPAKWNGDFRYSETAKEAELDPAQLSSLGRFQNSQQTWQDLLVDPAPARTAGNAAVARAASGAWRGHNGARNAFLRPQQASLDARLLDGVRISSTRKVSTVSQQGVQFPITVRNDLDPASEQGGPRDPYAVRVRLSFASDNSSRLSIKSIASTPIAPKDSFTANAAVTARANGTVPVIAQLYTDSGRKVGRPVEIEVQVTQNGTTGWAIALAAGVVLIGSTSFRIRQVTRERARAAAAGPAEPEPVSGLTSAPPAEVDPAERHDPSSTGA